MAKTHYIAILTMKDVAFNYGDDYETIVAGITDWSEVSEEDYMLLSKYCSGNHGKYNYRIIERLDVKPNFIPKTIEQFKLIQKAEDERVAKQKAKEEAEKAERARARAERAAKKALKEKQAREQAEKVLLEQLKKKYEGS